MSADYIKHAQHVELGDYMSADTYRTVDKEAYGEEGGLSELRILITVKPEFAKTLSIRVPGSGTIYGFVRMGERLKELNGTPLAETGAIEKIELVDWGDKFLMLMERKDKKELPFFVAPESVRALLETCRLAPVYRKVQKY